jgi:hypothetical protein
VRRRALIRITASSSSPILLSTLLTTEAWGKGGLAVSYWTKRTMSVPVASCVQATREAVEKSGVSAVSVTESARGGHPATTRGHFVCVRSPDCVSTKQRSQRCQPKGRRVRAVRMACGVVSVASDDMNDSCGPLARRQQWARMERVPTWN